MVRKTQNRKELWRELLVPKVDFDINKPGYVVDQDSLKEVSKWRKFAEGNRELNPEVRDLLISPVDKAATARQLTIEGAVKKPHGRFIRGTDHTTNVFTKATIDHGSIKKGDTLGVMTRAERRSYEAALGKHQDKQRAEVQEKGMPDNSNLMASHYAPYTAQDYAREKAEDAADASSLTIQRRNEQEAISNVEDKLADVLPKNNLLAGGPSFEIPGKKKTGMGSLTPEGVEQLKKANPGAADKIDQKFKESQGGVDLPFPYNSADRLKIKRQNRYA